MQKPPIRPVRRPVMGWIVFAIGLFLFLSAGAIAFVGESMGDDMPGIFVFWVILLFAAGGILQYRGMKLKALGGEQLLKKDARPPIVYLRSFAAERSDNTVWRFFQGAFGRRLSMDLPAWAPSEQWLLGKYLSRLGPYIAIGRPGEKLPEMGAARIYVPDEAWQTRVHDLLHRAALIVVRVGSGSGLHWEIDQIIRQTPPTKLLLILPIRNRSYEQFRTWANGVFPRPLPKVKSNVRLLMFDAYWNAVSLPAGPQLPATLAPYLQQNFIDPPSKGSWWEQWFGIYK